MHPYMGKGMSGFWAQIYIYMYSYSMFIKAGHEHSAAAVTGSVLCRDSDYIWDSVGITN